MPLAVPFRSLCYIVRSRMSILFVSLKVLITIVKEKKIHTATRKEDTYHICDLITFHLKLAGPKFV